MINNYPPPVQWRIASVAIRTQGNKPACFWYDKN